MRREQITHSEISPMSWEERCFLEGVPLDEPAAILIEDDLPFEFDPQHSCTHGTCRTEAAAAGFGLSLAVCASILLWCGLVKLLVALVGAELQKF